MKAKIVITLDGQVSVVIEDGTFEAGRGAIEKLMSQLQAAGLDMALIGQVEQHRHDDPDHLARHVALDHNQ